jgi:DNA helicase II / ATP-dependent DNA helicase PcrA
LYEEYRKELRKANALDFDDLLLEAVRLLKSAPQVREYYNRRFQYLLIDEYQDTNRPQYELMRLLAGDRHNVCAVGDEDQSIYSWRGADIRNILEFEQDFPEAKIIRLEQNYRSTQNILQAASAVVANNVRRKGKNLWTSRQGGTKIGYYEAPDGENEALFAADRVARYVREATEKGEDPRAAVLYRTNSQSRLFEEAMRRYGLKYHVVGGFSFYERAEIKDMISYLKVIQNPDDSISLLRVINTPARGIGKGTIDILENLALETGLSLWGAIGEAIRRQLLPPRALASLKNFQQLIADARAMQAGSFAEQLTESAASAQSAEERKSTGEPETRDLRVTSPEGTAFVSSGRKSWEEEQVGASPAGDGTNAADATAFDPNEFGNFSFDFGVPNSESEEQTRNSRSLDSDETLASEPSISTLEDNALEAADDNALQTTAPDPNAFPAPTVSTADLLKFLIDRTGYIKLLEAEDTPEAYSRIENLRELVNAAMDSRDRGETLDQFLDHAALIADADDYDARAQITLMSLHAAKGLEFPLVFLSGLEEGLFPHSRTMLVPEDVEEERRLCYVGMTRAMDQLILTRAVYRRRYGTDLPEASVPSRFLEEVPGSLIEELGTSRARVARAPSPAESFGSRYSQRPDRAVTHYSYEDEDQSTIWHDSSRDSRPRLSGRAQLDSPSDARGSSSPARAYNSIENIAEFFASRGKKFTAPKAPVEEPTGKRGFRPGQKVRHPKYGEGTVYQREGEGEEAKITVQFPRFGLKKLVEKYAQLERA